MFHIIIRQPFDCTQRYFGFAGIAGVLELLHGVVEQYAGYLFIEQAPKGKQVFGFGFVVALCGYPFVLRVNQFKVLLVGAAHKALQVDLGAINQMA